MSSKIDRDHERFRQIIRGKIKENLHRHLSRGAMEGRKGKKKISIPINVIDLPHFRYGQGQGGVGSGDGEEGATIGKDPGEGEGRAGNQPGDNIIEVDVDIEELVDMAFEELRLPRIKDKGKKNIMEPVHKYKSLRKHGPESLRDNKRTFKNALKRSIAMGEYDPKKPVIIPIREDKLYRSRKTYYLPKASAVIINMMDVSGSMGEKQKEIVRTEAYLIDRWLKRHYDGIDIRYITHDSAAREVDRDTFFHKRESGGTKISSAYKLCAEIIERDYPPSQYNIYCFHFSDGDNWEKADTEECLDILENRLIPNVNMFGYGQVNSPYGSGEFINDLGDLALYYSPVLVLSDIGDMEGIWNSIVDFFGQ